MSLPHFGDPTLKAILFDIGNVITTYRPGDYYRYLSRISGIGLRAIEKKFGRYGALTETGKLSLREFNRIIARELEMEGKELDWISYYSRNVRLKKEVVAYARQLHKKYVIACLSNTDKGSYDYTMRSFNLSFFDKRFVSFRIGARKPDKRAYDHAMKGLGVKPEEILFVDDMKRNVDAARKMGMKAIVFTDIKSLKAQASKYL